MSILQAIVSSILLLFTGHYLYCAVMYYIFSIRSDFYIMKCKENEVKRFNGYGGFDVSMYSLSVEHERLVVIRDEKIIMKSKALQLIKDSFGYMFGEHIKILDYGFDYKSYCEDLKNNNNDTYYANKALNNLMEDSNGL